MWNCLGPTRICVSLLHWSEIISLTTGRYFFLVSLNNVYNCDGLKIVCVMLVNTNSEPQKPTNNKNNRKAL